MSESDRSEIYSPFQAVVTVAWHDLMFKLPLSGTVECNCSICGKSGSLRLIVPECRLLSGEQSIAT